MGFGCPVCGYSDLKNPPRTWSGSPSDEICLCCGYQFGYHDDSEGISYEEWRQRWIGGRMRWSSVSSAPPPDFESEEQLRRLKAS